LINIAYSASIKRSSDSYYNSNAPKHDIKINDYCTKNLQIFVDTEEEFTFFKENFMKTIYNRDLSAHNPG